ncbi:hypothetical protein ACFCYN_03720 [Gottfriedia sp. NPDC056225]|uniref:hypothetical protein n=1 Tax=Gottfriedia sp. NPDC056225 TaxID=3345751 RepID=UPI0035D65426
MIGSLMTILFIVITIYKILKSRKIIKELTKLQISGVFLTYLITIFFMFICIYYGGNWIGESLSNLFVRKLIQIIVIILTLIIFGNILEKTLKKITNGVLPKK